MDGIADELDALPPDAIGADLDIFAEDEPETIHVSTPEATGIPDQDNNAALDARPAGGSDLSPELVAPTMENAGENVRNFLPTVEASREKVLADLRAENPNATKEEKAEAHHEQHEQDRDRITEDAQQRIASVVRPPDGRPLTEEQRQYYDHVEEKADQLFSAEHDAEGVSNVERRYEEVLRIESTKDEKEREQARRKYISGLQQELGATREDAEAMYDQISSTPEVYRVLQQQKQALLILEHDPESYEQFVALTEEDDPDAMDAFIKGLDNEELSRQLQGLRENEQLSEQVIALRTQEMQQETASLQQETTLQLTEQGVSLDAIASLPPEGLAAVQNLVQEGGPVVIGALLANGASINDEEFLGIVSGQYVFLNFDDGMVHFIGENAADRTNKVSYKIHPPTPAEFEAVLIHSIGDQNRMPYIANHSKQAREIYAVLVDNPNDENLPNAEEISGFRNFLILLAGEGHPDEAEEERRFRELGILNASGEVNPSRVELFQEAIERYVSDGVVMHEGDSPVMANESPGFGYQDAVTLARLWDKDESRFPESLSELKTLTKIRLEGGDIHDAEHL